MMIYFFNIFLGSYLNIKNNIGGLGIGDWGLGIGDWGQSPVPNRLGTSHNTHLLFLNLPQQHKKKIKK